MLPSMGNSVTATDIALRAHLRDCAASFAQDHIAPRLDLRDHTIIPSDLWQSVGETGLAQIALPTDFGGAGGDLRTLVMAAEALAERGGNLGMVTSWMGRQLISRLHIWGHGTEAQLRTYLPDLAAGRTTPCLAISEPGAGAHPKHLAAEARRDGVIRRRPL